MFKKFGFIKSALVALAMVGVVFPQTLILADQQAPTPKIKVVDANATLDVTLAKDGTFNGRAVDHSGNPVEGAKVVIKRGKTEVGQIVTDEKGNFTLASMKTGTYSVSSGATSGTYRFWSEKAAPPSSRPQLNPAASVVALIPFTTIVLRRFEMVNGSLTRSVSNTCLACSSAHVTPTSPVPAPSSRTALNATKEGLAVIKHESIKEHG